MHADRPGDRARLLYWYRTAPGITLGRSPLDEDAIRTIEEQHPDIDFDWPAILALAEAMTPEDESPPRAPQLQQRQGRRQRSRDQKPPQSPSVAVREQTGELRRDERVDAPSETAGPSPSDEAAEAVFEAEPPSSIDAPPRNLLLEELAGREIGSRLRARHAEILARIDDLDVDGSVKDALFKRAEAIDPELWMTPEEVLDGVRNADAHYEKLLQSLRE